MSPTQVVVLIDLQGSVDADEMLAVVPPTVGGHREVRRLTEFGARPLPTPPAVVPPGEWATIRDAVESLRHWFDGLVRQGAVSLYLGGQAPLPVFTHLGQALSRFSGEQHLIARRFGGAWELVPLSDGPHVADVEWLDVKKIPAAPSEAVGGVGIYVDTGGRYEPLDAIREAVEAEGTWLSHLVVARASTPLTITPTNAASLAREVVATLSRLPSLFPSAERWLLFVAGAAPVAFMVGRALNPNLFARVGITQHHAGHYTRVYDLPSGAWRGSPVRLAHIEVEGFFAFERTSVDLGPINVLIGPNGAGKSSLVKLFGMLRAAATGRLQAWVTRQGGAESVLHWGPRHTPALRVRLGLQTLAHHDTYQLSLEPTADGRLAVREESLIVARRGTTERPLAHRRSSFEAALGDDAGADDPVAAGFQWLLRGSHTCHVHDTSMVAAIRGAGPPSDARSLHEDASNLAAVLARLKRESPRHYERILVTLRRVLPFLDDFDFATAEGARVRLDWRRNDQPVDYVFGPHQLSDGALRVIALYTLLLLPEAERPRVIVLDEPELGLHPAAVSLLAALIRSASTRTQFVLATQSTLLLDQFEADEVIVAECRGGRGVLRRPDAAALRQWREDFEYSVSDQWAMNLFGGVP